MFVFCFTHIHRGGIAHTPGQVGLHDVWRQSLHQFDHGESYRDPRHLLILHILRLHGLVLLITLHLLTHTRTVIQGKIREKVCVCVCFVPLQ